VTAGPYPVELGRTLAPGDVVPVRVALDAALPAGPWTARIDVRSGLLERSAQARITFPDEAGEQNAPVRAEALSPAEDPKILIPIAAGLVGLLLLLLLVTALVTSRRRARRDVAG
jgi:hypothetical protein